MFSVWGRCLELLFATLVRQQESLFEAYPCLLLIVGHNSENLDQNGVKDEVDLIQIWWIHP